KGVSFYLALIPDKKTVYPENYPDTILQDGNISKMDMITDYLNDKTDVKVINMTSALIKAKEDAVVYSPRVDNAHWNNYGAMIGYRELISEIQKDYKDVNL